MENIINNRHQKHLNEFERGQISILIAQGYSPYRIAKLMNRAENTIRNEIQRGRTTIIVDGWKEKTVYFPERGQAIYERNRARVCCKPKLENAKYKEFIAYIESAFLRSKYSIEVLYNAAIKNKGFVKENTVCIGTIYTYIDKGYLRIRNIDLPCKMQRRTAKSAVVRVHRRLYGRSIEERHEDIKLRNEFGHWEIDTVIGKNAKNQSALLVMTERKTRMEIIRKIPRKSCEAVMSEIAYIQNKLGDDFSKIFRTITSDNGTEFSRLHELECTSCTKVYYAHPFSSFERGSNERNNRIIRYFIRKGKSINNFTKEKIQYIQDWMNNMPRGILEYSCAAEEFRKELKDKKIAFEPVTAQTLI